MAAFTATSPATRDAAGAEIERATGAPARGFTDVDAMLAEVEWNNRDDLPTAFDFLINQQFWKKK